MAWLLDSKAKVALLVTGVALVAAMVGYLSYHDDVAKLREERHRELSAIGELKAKALEDWRRERLSNGRLNSSGILQQRVVQWLAAPGDAARKEAVLERLREFRDAGGYQSMIVAAPDGRVLLSLEPSPALLEPEAQGLVARVVATGSAEVGDFFKSEAGGRILLDTAAPIVGADGAPVAALILRTDARGYLYPLLQSWPTPSRTAETLLVRREGKAVVFLNDLRHRAGAALSLRIPLAQRETPAVLAALGQNGVVEGADYRGVAVLADVRAVAGSPWFLVAKVDSEEFFADARYHALASALVVALVAFAAALAAALLYTLRQKRLLQDLAVARARVVEGERRYRVLFEESPDALAVVVGPSWRLLDANAATVAMFRAEGRESLSSHSLWDLAPGTQPDGSPSEAKGREMIAAAERFGAQAFEWTCRRLDGEVFPAEVQLSRVQLAGGPAIQACVRDVSERSRLEEARRYDERRAAAMLALFSSSHASPREGVAGALEQAVALTGSHLGFIGFIDEARQTMSAHLWSEKAMAECAMSDKPTEFKLAAAGLWAEPVRQKRTVTVNDYGRPDPMLKGCPAGHVQLTRFMGVPVVRDGHVVMVCGLANKERAYDEIDERQVRLFLDGLWAVTCQRRAEAALRESEAQFRTLIETAPDAVFVQAEGRFLYLNAAAERLFGVSRHEELVGASLMDRVAPEYHEAVRERIRLQAEAGVVAPLMEQEYLRLDGTRVPVETTAVRTRFQGQDARLVFVRDITERKKAEEAGATAETLLRFAGRAARFGAWSVDLATNRVFWSDAVADIHGMPRGFSPLVEEGIAFYAPEWRKRIEDVFGACVRDGTPYDEEMEIVAAGGRRVWVRTLGEAVRDRSGKITKVQGAFQDISESKRVQRELDHKNAVLSSLLESTPVGVFMVEAPSGKPIFANTAAHKILGRGVLGDATAQSLADDYQAIRLPEGVPYPAEEMPILLGMQGKSATVDDMAIVRPDGKQTLLEVFGNPVRDAHGKVWASLVSFLDVTERRKAEEALRESKEYLENLINHANAPIVVWDAQLRITRANRAFELLTGRSSVDVLGRPLDALFPASPLAGVRAGERWDSAEIEIQHVDGSVRTVLWNSAVITGADGKTQVATIAQGQDITGRKKAEEERQQLQSQLAQSDRLASMGLLAAGVAHEINNPLSFVLYNLETLVEDIPQLKASGTRARRVLAETLGEDELRALLAPGVELLDGRFLADVEERFRDALTGAQRIKEIARGLGAFARVEKDELAPVDLRDAIESALTIARNEIKYRAQIVKDLSVTAPVLGSEGRLSQVFLNLLVNAAHAIAEGNVEKNRIRVRTWQEGEAVFAEVSDTGSGIAPEHLGKIFEPFFTTKPVGSGSGLGLHIARNIVTACGGTIGVESKVGEGTRFLIRLPAVSAEVGAEDATAERPPDAEAAGRILVVDDDAGVRAALARILKSHEVVMADSGEAGLAVLAADQAFDVVLCDLMMPQMSGIEFHRWVVKHHPALAKRVVFVTGGAFTPAGRAYLEMVDNLRVEKPFDATNLRKLVAGWVAAARDAR